MDQENLELKVWKDLAISKQILMRTASDALGLPLDCSADALQKALDIAIRRGNEADTAVGKAQTAASNKVAVMQRKLENIQRDLAEAVGVIDAAKTGRIEAERRVTAARDTNAKELKKVAEQLTDKQKTIKAIHTALADTPENVVKKLKKLKKEKFDELTVRRRVEDEVRALKKQKRKLEGTAEENKSSIEKSAKLVDKYRELYALCKRQREQLESLVEDKGELAKLPEMDEQILSG